MPSLKNYIQLHSTHKRPTISQKFGLQLEELKQSRIAEMEDETKDHTIQSTCKFMGRSGDSSRFRGVSKNGSKWKVSVLFNFFFILHFDIA